MDFYRAREDDINYIKYEKSIIHNTILIAAQNEKKVSVVSRIFKDKRVERDSVYV